jgi:hypothetical protein
MSDTLLFLHLLSAVVVFSAVATLSAVALGAKLDVGTVMVFQRLWNIGLVGLLVFGVWLAIDLDSYEIWDAWIIIAILIWAGLGPLGDRLPLAYRDAEGGELPARVIRLHWLAVALVLVLLADMIWKPFL